MPFPFTEDKRPTATVEEPTLTPVDNGCITKVPTPFESRAPYMILGLDQRLWYSAGGTAGGFIGAVETNFPYTVTEYGPLTGGALQLTIGPDGNIWFVEQGNYDCLQSPPSKVGRILTHKPYTITEFPVPGPISPLYGIATGADGNLWFTRIGDPGGCSTPPAPEEIARILPYSPYTIHVPAAKHPFEVSVWPLTLVGAPNSVEPGPDGNMWFTEGRTGYAMGRFNPFTGEVSEFPIVTNAYPRAATCRSWSSSFRRTSQMERPQHKARYRRVDPLGSSNSPAIKATQRSPPISKKAIYPAIFHSTKSYSL